MKSLYNKTLILFCIISEVLLHSMDVVHEFKNGTKSETFNLHQDSSHLTVNPRIIATTQNPLHLPENASHHVELTAIQTNPSQATVIPSGLDLRAQHSEKMEAPLQTYVSNLDVKAAQRYSHISSELRTKIELPYALKAIHTQSKGMAGGDVLGYNKVAVDAIEMTENWEGENPSDLQKIVAGLDSLEKIYAKDSKFNDAYKPQEKNEFMADSASTDLAKLQSDFSHVPVEILKTYLLKHLSENKKYQKKWIIWDDITQPIKIKAVDITANPGWPTDKNSAGDYIGSPSELQKIYAMMESIEAITVKALQNNETTLNPSLSSIALSLPRQIYTKGTQQALQEAARHPAAKKAVNTIYNHSKQQLVNAVGDAIDNASNQGVDAYLQDTPETIAATQALQHKALQTGVQHGATALKDLLIAANDPQAEPPFTPDEKTQAATQGLFNTAKDIIDAQLGVVKPIAPTEPAKTILQQKDPNESAEITFSDTITDDIKKQLNVTINTTSEQNSIKSEPTSDTSGIATPENYFITTLKSLAQSARNNAEGCKAAIKNMIAHISHIFRLTEQQTTDLNAVADDQINIVIKDTSSWFYATDKEFDSKFNTWIHVFLVTLYEKMGITNPGDLRVITTMRQNNDPSSPTMTIIYNTQNKTIKSATVHYDNYSYSVDLADIHTTTDSYTITTPLYNKQQKRSFLNAQVSDKAIKNITESWRTSSQDPAVKTLLSKWADYVDTKLTQPISDGSIFISFNKESPSNFTQNVIKTALPTKEFPDLSTVTTIMQYPMSNPNQIITCAGDIFAPSINLELNPQGNLESIKISHTDPWTNKTTAATTQTISYNKTTDEYIIRAQFETPQELPTEINSLQDLLNHSVNTVQNKIAENAWPQLIQFINNAYGVTDIKAADTTIKTAIDESAKFLTDPIPTAIQKMVIKYNPATKKLTTQTLKMLSNKKTITTNMSYSLS